MVEEDEEEATPPPRQRARKSAEDEDDAEEAEEVRKRSKKRGKKKDKKRSPLLLYGLLGGFGLLLFCSAAGVVAWWLLTSRGVTDELKFMPDNCQMLAAIQMDELLQSGAFKELRREIPEIEQALTQDKNNELGLGMDDIEKIVFGNSSVNANEMITVVRTKKPVSAQDMRTNRKGTTYTEVKVGKYLLHEPADANSPAFCVPDKKVVIVGRTEALRTILQRDKKPVFPEGLQMAMKQADFSKTIAFALDLKAGQSKPGAPGAMPMMGPNPMFQNGLDKADGLAIQAKIGSEVRLDVTVLCRDSKSAEDLHKQIDTALGLLKNLPNLSKENADLLDAKNFKVAGANVQYSGSFKVSPLIQAYKMQKGLVAGPQGAGMPPAVGGRVPGAGVGKKKRP